MRFPRWVTILGIRFGACDAYEKVEDSIRPEPKVRCAFPEMDDTEKVLSLLMERQSQFYDEEFWALVGRTWIFCKRGKHGIEQFRQLFESGRPKREFLMTRAERRSLARQPSTFTVYRGCNPKVNKEGLSWTLSKSIAEGFARVRFPFGPRLVRTGTCRRVDVIAYYGDYDEEEILIDPKHVTITAEE